ncbi:Ca-activated chloride channel family protein [Lachnospiraceae bacterium XBB2008]|nr:Ca-activated chloride channel family protein [Lachnospiraceae bacterium XBB2008]
MKKKTIAALLIGTTLATTITGCGSSGASHSASDTSTTYIAPEYPEASPAECWESEAATTGDYADTGATAECWESEPAAEYPETGDACYASESYTYNYSTDSMSAKIGSAADSTYCPGYYYPAPNYNYGENYNTVIENEFKEVYASPLSTFGADIDTASYSNLRRMINDGYNLYDIPAGSIRTEELINYFNYDYREPGSNDTFAVNAQIIDCPWNKETKLVNLGIKAKELEDIENVPSNIVFLVDVSGSMDDYDKLPLLQMGLDMLVDDLDENDRVSIVTYASSSDIVIAGVSGDEHTTIKKAINALSAGGSTNGGDGIKSAYRLAEKYFIEGGNNRVIMATDGDLNVGITSEDELEELISKKKESGVFLSVLGFGTGNYNEAALETLADKGNGNYSYIDCLSEAKKVLIDEFNSTLFTVAKDVKFQIEFNPRYVSEYRLVGYENRQMAARDFNDDTKDGGEIGSGHAMTVMYEIRMNDESDAYTDDLRYQSTDLSETGITSNEWMTVSVRYKEPEEDESKLIYFPIRNECYTRTPNCDTLFAAYVAECGMILNDSSYIGNLDMRDVSKQISGLDLDDEYKEEFLDLIKQL